MPKIITGLVLVLTRELRAAARRRSTFWLRVAVALLGLGAMFLLLVDTRILTFSGTGRSTTLSGGALFALLHTVLSCTLLLAAPLFAADCIARERREGTLVLLALTPLRPFEIVLGKAAAQIVRLLSLWLACLPVLLVPVLMGGVGWVDIQFAWGIQLMIVTGGLASGVMATSLARRWTSAAGLAVGLTLFCGQFITTAAGGVLLAVSRAQGSAGNAKGLEQASVWLASIIVWIGSTGLPGDGFGRLIASFPPWVEATARWNMWGGIGVTIFCFGFAVWLAGRRVQQAFRPPLPNQAQIDRARRWFAPRFFQATRERRRRRWLATNPARWLFGFSPTGGLGRWGWVLVIGLSWGILIWLATADQEIFELTRLLPLLLSLGMAMAAAASFRQEIEEGTLELLLVTPLSARRLVWARAQQIWALFVPAAALSVGLALIRPTAQSSDAWISAEWAGLISLVSLPLIGIRYAVRRLHPLNGFFWTAFTAGLLPLLVGLAAMTLAAVYGDLDYSEWENYVAEFFTFGFGLTQLLLALVWGWLAANDLERRWYMFRPLQRRAA